MKKLIVLFFVALISIVTASAQDVITKKDGKKINAHVESIGDKDISYSTISLSGDKQFWLISISEVKSITFENGHVEDFSRGNTVYKAPEKETYKVAPQTYQSKPSTSTQSSKTSSTEEETINTMYFDASYVIPLMSNGSDYSKWGLDFGVGYQKPLSDIAFLSIPLVDIAFTFVNSKKYDVNVTNFYYTWPVQVGLGNDGMNVRFGGFIGGASSKVTSKTIGNSKDAAFIYGLKFNAKLFVDIGFELIWSAGSSSPAKMLTVGFRF